MQKTILMGGALLAAVVMASGAAQASDDCRSGSFRGYYGTLCLFDDHNGSYSYCGEGYCYSSTYDYNNMAVAYWNGPAAGGSSTTGQANESYESCDAGGCYRSDGTSTSSWTYLWTAGAPETARASVRQGSYDTEAPWGAYHSESTEVYAYAYADGRAHGVNVGQWDHEEAFSGYHGCYTTGYVYSSVYDLSVSGGCALHTPAGDVPLLVPMLHDTCVATPVPETTLCGWLPHAPEDTGLPFL